MDQSQLYETTIYNRDGRQGFAFVTVPSRSLISAEVEHPDGPNINAVADALGMDPIALDTRRIEPLEPWTLPFIIDGLLGRWIGPDAPFEWRYRLLDAPATRGPSRFAQALAYEPLVPFESSPLKAQSLSGLTLASSGAVGALGAIDGHPLLLLYLPAGIILCGAAKGVGEALQIGLRTKLLHLMGIDEEPPDKRAGS